ncbi:hypothetical protein JHK86_015831 [Glycine max]|nr:hypothetical protein JHK86_015831 [Glycine max]
MLPRQRDLCGLNSIAEINDDKETLKVVVRLINMWTIPRSPKFTIELILVDKKVSGSINNCTLWEALAMELKDYLDRHVTRSVVLLLSMAKMKEARANGWIYEACLKCNKKVYEEALSFICVGCGNESASTIPKFRVEVRVAQSLEYAIFTLWDRECYALINETATDIKQIIIYEEGVFDPIDIPEALNRVLGKRLAFRFKDEDEPSISLVHENNDVIDSRCKSFQCTRWKHKNLLRLGLYVDMNKLPSSAA